MHQVCVDDLLLFGLPGGPAALSDFLPGCAGICPGIHAQHCAPRCCSRPGSRCLTRRGYAHCREQGPLKPGNAPTALVAEGLGATARLFWGLEAEAGQQAAVQTGCPGSSSLDFRPRWCGRLSAALPCLAHGQEGRATGSIRHGGPWCGSLLGPRGRDFLATVDPAPSPLGWHRIMSPSHSGGMVCLMFQVSYLTAARLVSRAPSRWHVLQAGVRTALPVR